MVRKVSKELTNLIEGATETGCRREASKPTHGIIPLFDATMILFHYIVEVVMTLVENFTTKRLADIVNLFIGMEIIAEL